MNDSHELEPIIRARTLSSQIDEHLINAAIFKGESFLWNLEQARQLLRLLDNELNKSGIDPALMK